MYLVSMTKNGITYVYDNDFKEIQTIPGLRPRGIAQNGSEVAIANFDHLALYHLEGDHLRPKEVIPMGSNCHDVIYEDNKTYILSIPGGLMSERGRVEEITSDESFYINTYTSEGLMTSFPKQKGTDETPFMVWVDGKPITKYVWDSPHHVIKHTDGNHYVCDSGTGRIVCIESGESWETGGFCRSLQSLKENLLFVNSKARNKKDATESCVSKLNLKTGKTEVLKEFPTNSYIYQALKL